MKSTLLNKINVSDFQSFIVRSKIYPQAYSLWHHHNEYEILYFVKNEGTAYVGDKIFPYQGGTLMLFCPNLSHMFIPKMDSVNNPNAEIDAYVLHFSYDSIKSILKKIHEFKPLKKLFNNWERGMVFNDLEKNKEILKIMQEIVEVENYKRIILFFELLNILEKNNDFDFIANPGYLNSVNLPKARLEKVYEFTIANYGDSSITLEKVAESINMNKTAFCRYFKKITTKSYFQFLNEIRIGNACKILMEDENKSVTDIAFLCGFNNISNFNRQFKLIKGQTPTSFIKSRKL